MPCDITVKSSLLDEPISIKLSSLPSHKKIRLTLSCIDGCKQIWQSNASFLTDTQGELDLASANALSGTYTGIDPEGLFWSMSPLCDARTQSLFPVSSLPSLTYELHVYQGKICLGKKIFSRSILADQVARIDIQEAKVTGTLFLPRHETTCPGIMMVPGSGGMITLESTAALLASKGYAVLIVGYYRDKNLADELYELPLERFRDAILWFKSHPRIHSDHVIAMGYSKGAEALLATLAYFPSMSLKGVVLHAPTHVIWQGMGRGKPRHESSWSLFNEPLSFLAYQTDRLVFTILKKKLLAWLLPNMSPAFSCLAAYKKALRNKRREEEARIPVTQIKTPILFISGENDCLWPSSCMAEKMMHELKAAQSPYQCKHLRLPGIGHVIRHPGLPTTISQIVFAKLTLEMGGQAQLAARSTQVYWNELVQFTHEMMSNDEARSDTYISA